MTPPRPCAIAYLTCQDREESNVYVSLPISQIITSPRSHTIKHLICSEIQAQSKASYRQTFKMSAALKDVLRRHLLLIPVPCMIRQNCVGLSPHKSTELCGFVWVQVHGTAWVLFSYNFTGLRDSFGQQSTELRELGVVLQFREKCCTKSWASQSQIQKCCRRKIVRRPATALRYG